MEPSAPAVGARVLLSGLQARSDLNGKYGVVTALDMTRLRAGVKIEGSGEQNQEQEQEQEQVMCKFSNLTVVEAAGGGGAKASEQAKVKATSWLSPVLSRQNVADRFGAAGRARFY